MSTSSSSAGESPCNIANPTSKEEESLINIKPQLKKKIEKKQSKQIGKENIQNDF